MTLSRINQEKTFRFGGTLQKKKSIKDKNFNPEDYLNTLNENEFKLLFFEWLAQCWIYDSTEAVPITQEQLESFELTSLIPEFKRSYINGSWKQIVECSGGTLDEMYLVGQMLFKQNIVFMLNKNQKPPPTLPEVAKYYFIPEDVIFPIFLEFINHNLAITLISDGVDHHVLNAYGHDIDRKVIQYEDNIGANKRCFLNRENNALQIDSNFIGHNSYGNWCWEVPEKDFQKAFYGVELLIQDADLWNQIAMQIGEEKLKQKFFERYGKL